MEEVGSAFGTFPPTRPELFAADAMVIADMGSLRPGVPTLTIALRGTAVVIGRGREPSRGRSTAASSAALHRTRC